MARRIYNDPNPGGYDQVGDDMYYVDGGKVVAKRTWYDPESGEQWDTFDTVMEGDFGDIPDGTQVDPDDLEDRDRDDDEDQPSKKGRTGSILDDVTQNNRPNDVLFGEQDRSKANRRKGMTYRRNGTTEVIFERPDGTTFKRVYPTDDMPDYLFDENDDFQRRQSLANMPAWDGTDKLPQSPDPGFYATPDFEKNGGSRVGTSSSITPIERARSGGSSVSVNPNPPQGGNPLIGDSQDPNVLRNLAQYNPENYTYALQNALRESGINPYGMSPFLGILMRAAAGLQQAFYQNLAGRGLNQEQINEQGYEPGLFRDFLMNAVGGGNVYGTLAQAGRDFGGIVDQARQYRDQLAGAPGTEQATLQNMNPALFLLGERFKDPNTAIQGFGSLFSPTMSRSMSQGFGGALQAMAGMFPSQAQDPLRDDIFKYILP